MTSLGQRCLQWSLAELRRGVKDAEPGHPAGARIREYLAPCVRHVGSEEVRLGLSSGNWCAAAACAAAYSSVEGRERIPHGYRASALELKADAMAAGAWIGADTNKKRSGASAWVPAPGDLAIFHRGAPGSWEGHVARVMTTVNAAGVFKTIGANEGPRGEWRISQRSVDDADLLGFIAYPRQPDASDSARDEPDAQEPTARTMDESNEWQAPIADALSASMASTSMASGTRAPGTTARRWLAGVAMCLMIAGLIASPFVARIGVNALWGIEAALIAGLMIAIGIAACGKPSGILIDVRNRASLSRFQLVAWMILIMSAYLTAILLRLGRSDPLAIELAPQLWGLLGISVASSAGRSAIHYVKRRTIPPISIYDHAAAAMGRSIPQVRASASGVIAGNASPADASLVDVFTGDELSNATTVDLGKVQMFLFTLMALLAYAVAISRVMPQAAQAAIFVFPVPGTSLLSLLALSHCAYVGGKAMTRTPKATDRFTNLGVPASLSYENDDRAFLSAKIDRIAAQIADIGATVSSGQAGAAVVDGLRRASSQLDAVTRSQAKASEQLQAVLKQAQRLSGNAR